MVKSLSPAHFSVVKQALSRLYGTQVEFSERTDISRTTILKFLEGTAISDRKFLELADALELNPDEICLHDSPWDSAPTPLPLTRKERQEELTIIRRWVFRESCRVLSIYGLGKIGKTEVISSLYHEACQASIFDGGLWVDFQRQPLSLDALLERIANFWPAASNILEWEGLSERIDRLINFLANQRYLIVLKRIDVLFQDDVFFGQYKDEYRDYEELFRCLHEKRHKSCCVIIGRQPPRDVLSCAGNDLKTRTFPLTGLNQSNAVSLLERKSLSGNESDMNRLAQIYMGHPWLLSQLSSYIRPNSRSIRRYIEGNEFVLNGTLELLEEHFRNCSSVEKIVLFWLTVNRESVTETFLYKEDMSSVIGRPGLLLEALKSLKYSSLVQQHDEYWVLPEIILRFMTVKMIEEFYEGLIRGNVASLNNYPLLKVTSSDYVRSEQINCIAKPILSRLIRKYGSSSALERRIRELLEVCRQSLHDEPGYAPGNLFNLLVLLKEKESIRHKPEIKDLNLSNLCLWQSDLTKANLHNANLRNSNLYKTALLSTCAGLLSLSRSGNGEVLAASDASGNIYIWQVKQECQLKLLFANTSHDHWCRAVSVSFDGSFVASGGEDQVIHIFDVQRSTAFPFRGYHNHRIRAIEFNRNYNNLLASAGDDGQVILWNIRKGGTPVAKFSFYEDKVRALAFSSDGKLLVSATEGGILSVHPIDSTNSYESFSNPRSFSCRCKNKLRAIALSPDDKTIATGGDDGHIWLWDVQSFREISKSTVWHTDWIRSISFSPDGKSIASSGEDCNIKLWDSRTLRYLKTLEGHKGRVWSVVFGVGGQFLFSASGDQTLKTWDLLAGNCLKTVQGHTSKVRSVAFSPNGQSLVSGSDDRMVRLWNIKDNSFKNLYDHLGRVWSVACTFDGSYIVSVSEDRLVAIWDVRTQRNFTTRDYHTSWIRVIACAPKSLKIATGGDDSEIWLCDIKAHNKRRVKVKHNDWIQSLSFGWNSELGCLLLASASDDKIVRVLNPETDQLLLSLDGHSEPVRAVDMSPDGHWVVSGSNDKTVRLCEIGSGRCLAPLGRQEDAHEGWVRSVAFHPNFPKQQLIVSASYDRTIKLWDVSQIPATCRTLLGHDRAVSSVSFSSDGRLLASGSEDGTIRIWNVETGKCLDILKPPAPYENMDITNATELSDIQKEAMIVMGARED